MKRGDTVWEKFHNGKVRILSFNRRDRTFLVELLETIGADLPGTRVRYGINELSSVPGERLQRINADEESHPEPTGRFGPQ
jgi:hypothetical protein